MLRISHKHGEPETSVKGKSEQDLIDEFKKDFIKKHNAKFSSDRTRTQIVVSKVLIRKRA